MADVSRYKALADRLLGKLANAGVVTLKSTDLSSPATTQTASVRVKVLNRTAKTGEESARCEAIMSATAFPVSGAELVLKGVTYDIIEAVQIGTGSEHVAQKLVLHER